MRGWVLTSLCFLLLLRLNSHWSMLLLVQELQPSGTGQGLACLTAQKMGSIGVRHRGHQLTTSHPRIQDLLSSEASVPLWT